MSHHPASPKATIKNVAHSTHTTLSEPEDCTSSGVESFDEADMYPASYDDESVSDSTDSDGDDSDGKSDRNTGDMVRTNAQTSYINVRLSDILNSLMKSLHRDRTSARISKPYASWSRHSAMPRALGIPLTSQRYMCLMHNAYHTKGMDNMVGNDVCRTSDIIY